MRNIILYIILAAFMAALPIACVWVEGGRQIEQDQ
jgi:hypothetical protein